MSDAISTQGTKILRAPASSPASFTEITEVRSIGGPTETSDELDVTHLMSTGGRREYIQSFRDSDDLVVEMNYVPGDAVQQLLRVDYETGTINTWKVEYPDGATAVFEGFVKGRSSPAAVGEVLVFNVTIRISGQVTYTPS